MSIYLTGPGLMEFALRSLAEQRECISRSLTEQQEYIERGHQMLNAEHLLSGLIKYFSELNEDKIREEADYINWYYISSYSPLEIITNLEKDFPDDIKWINVSRRKDITEEFKTEFSHKIIKPNQYGYR